MSIIELAHLTKFIQSGPNFICIVCNRYFIRESVTLFLETKHKELVKDLFDFICSHNKFYIYKNSPVDKVLKSVKPRISLYTRCFGIHGTAALC